MKTESRCELVNIPDLEARIALPTQFTTHFTLQPFQDAVPGLDEQCLRRRKLDENRTINHPARTEAIIYRKCILARNLKQHLHVNEPTSKPTLVPKDKDKASPSGAPASTTKQSILSFRRRRYSDKVGRSSRGSWRTVLEGSGDTWEETWGEAFRYARCPLLRARVCI